MEERKYSSWLLERMTIGDVIRLRFGVSKIGRHSSCNIRITDSTYVSRYHAEIEVANTDQNVVIRDTNSINGIFVNDTLHRQKSVELKVGDTIGIGVSICVSNENNEAHLERPVYVLRYEPIKHFQNRQPVVESIGASREEESSHQHNIPTNVNKPVIRNIGKPQTSNANQENSENVSALNSVNKEGSPSALSSEFVIILSDDEDEDRMQPIKTVKTSISDNRILANEVPAAEGCGSTLPEDETKESSNKEIRKDDEGDLHVPVKSNLNKEFVRSVSVNIQNIFGETDDVILNKIKEINPDVYNDLNSKPTTKVAAVASPTDEHIVNLISDDDGEDDVVVDLGQITPYDKVQSNINPSLKMDNSEAVSGKQLEKEKSYTDKTETLESNNTNRKPPLHNSTSNLEKHVICEQESDNEDLEEFMFSQKIINDMKAELVDERNYDDNEDSNSYKHCNKMFPECEHIKQEPNESNIDTLQSLNGPIANENEKENDSSCWIISDDEDFDEELENKVSGWSSRLFSQSYSHTNMSQIFELDDHRTDDVSDEEANVDADYVDVDDDDDDDDFYNRQPDNRDKIIDDMFTTLNKKLQSGQERIEHKVRKHTTDDSQKDLNKSGIRKEEEFKENTFIQKRQTTCESNEIDSLLLKESSSETPKNMSESTEEKKRSEGDVVGKFVPEKKPLEEKSNKEYTTTLQTSPSSSAADEHVYGTDKATTSIVQKQVKSVQGPPPIINAPSLPKHKGKLRGVSAVANHKSPTAVKKNIAKKLSSVREKIRTEKYINEMKHKWFEKPSVVNKREKERNKIIKESRKDRLRELADKQQKREHNLKRKIVSDDKHRCKKPKIKVTPVNRGAFLTELNLHTEKDLSKMKIPKMNSKTGTDFDSNKQIQNITNLSATETKAPSVPPFTGEMGEKTSPSRSSLDSFETFSQELSKPDHLLLKRQKSKETKQSHTDNVDGGIMSVDGKKPRRISAVCRDAIVARGHRTTNKITFASMEKNFKETDQNQRKLELISSTRSCLTNVDEHNEKVVRTRKTVRFNDTPVVHYIERVSGADKKVVCKDALPLSYYKDRRQLIRRTFPIVDCTDLIISQILSWSNEWLKSRNAAVNAASEVIYPMPTQFSSFSHYKSIIFPLMKLEFTSLLEREYNTSSNVKPKPFRVSLEYVTENKSRLMLITKYNHQHKQSKDAFKYDLVVVCNDNVKLKTFAFVSSNRKGAGSYSTIVFEIIAKDFSKESFKTIKELNVRPVIDNVRVEFGAFNAVYQLEATPLFSKIINPLELLKCKPVPKKKISYKAFDLLNDKQRHVMLNTYMRVIDETTPNITLIQGPPGTGKSCVITNLALQILYGNEVRYLDKKILICAQSNAAVDVITRKLFDISLRMRPEIRYRLIRFGILSKMKAQVIPISLQKLVERDQLKKLQALDQTIQLENKENLKKHILQLEAQITDMLSREIKGTVEETDLFKKQKQLKLMQNILNQCVPPEDERKIYTWYLSNANIVCATLSSCVKLSQYINYFDICIIDEATQCTEPWTLLPLKFGINSLVLVGDTQQLPATVLSQKASELGMGTSMFTRIQHCLDNVQTAGTGTGTGTTVANIIYSLQTQYRMNPEICKWPNQYFYKNELINATITHEYKSAIMPFSVLNLAYSQNERCSNGKIINNLEAEFVAKLLQVLDAFIPSKCNSYGVITPYAHHRNTLEATIKSLGLTNIMVNTIDSYQGLEKDVIIISNARTKGIGFLSNPQRLNVALTRPKKCLILCGNFKNLETVPAWRCLLESARERNLYHELTSSCALDIETNVISKIRVKNQ